MRDGDRIEQCRRGKISQAALVVSTVRLVKKHTLPPSLKNQPKKDKFEVPPQGVDQLLHVDQLWRADKTKFFFFFRRFLVITAVKSLKKVWNEQKRLKTVTLYVTEYYLTLLVSVTKPQHICNEKTLVKEFQITITRDIIMTSLGRYLYAF